MAEDRMYPLTEMILDAEKNTGEQFEAIVVSTSSWGGRYSRPPVDPVGRDEGLALIADVGYIDAYGTYGDNPGDVAFYGYTPNWIVFLHTHDGLLSPKRIPRHPINCTPWLGAEAGDTDSLN